MLFDVVACGSAIQDFFLESAAFEKQADPYAPDGQDLLFRLGDKSELDDLWRASGGGATNAAVTFAHLGLQAACIARVGRDDSGQRLIDELEQAGVSSAFIQTDAAEPTGHSFILLAQAGQRAILTYRGASARISAELIPRNQLNARCFYVSALAGRLDLLREIFQQADRRDSLIAWNPGQGEMRHGLETLAPFLCQTDYLLLNREEAAGLTGLPPRDTRGILERLGGLVRQVFVMTDGPAGAYAGNADQAWHAAAFPCVPRNATGAGDAFGSGFVSGLLLGYELSDALRLASLNAASVVGQMGAKAGILCACPPRRLLDRVFVKPIFQSFYAQTPRPGHTHHS